MQYILLFYLASIFTKRTQNISSFILFVLWLRLIYRISNNLDSAEKRQADISTLPKKY